MMVECKEEDSPDIANCTPRGKGSPDFSWTITPNTAKISYTIKGAPECMRSMRRDSILRGNTGSNFRRYRESLLWKPERQERRDAHLTAKSHCHKSITSGVLMTDRSKMDQAAPPDGCSEPDGGSSGLRGTVDTSATWMPYASEDSDAALLERLHSGDSTAFEELFLRHYTAVYRVLCGVVGNAQEAEDLAQETFTAFYRQPPRLDGPGALGAWLYRVAVNRAYNALRSRQRSQRRLVWAEPEQQSNPQDEYLRREDRARVQAALAQLPERQSQLLLLRHSGLAYAEIATALDLAPGSVGTLLARAERAFLNVYQAIETAEIRD
jgi:RNA polymerase sigma-70 factor, ECF subfamily